MMLSAHAEQCVPRSITFEGKLYVIRCQEEEQTTVMKHGAVDMGDNSVEY